MKCFSEVKKYKTKQYRKEKKTIRSYVECLWSHDCPVGADLKFKTTHNTFMLQTYLIQCLWTLLKFSMVNRLQHTHTHAHKHTQMQNQRHTCTQNANTHYIIWINKNSVDLIIFSCVISFSCLNKEYHIIISTSWHIAKHYIGHFNSLAISFPISQLLFCLQAFHMIKKTFIFAILLMLKRLANWYSDKFSANQKRVYCLPKSTLRFIFLGYQLSTWDQFNWLTDFYCQTISGVVPKLIASSYCSQFLRPL